MNQIRAGLAKRGILVGVVLFALIAPREVFATACSVACQANGYAGGGNCNVALCAGPLIPQSPAYCGAAFCCCIGPLGPLPSPAPGPSPVAGVCDPTTTAAVCYNQTFSDGCSGLCAGANPNLATCSAAPSSSPLPSPAVLPSPSAVPSPTPFTQIANFNGLCTTPHSPQGQCTTGLLPWPIPFPNNNYVVTCNTIGPQISPGCGFGEICVWLVSITQAPTGITVQLVTGTASQSQAGTYSGVSCIGVFP